MRDFTRSTVELAMGDTRAAPSRQDAVEISRIGHDLAVALLQRLQISDHHLGNCFFRSP